MSEEQEPSEELECGVMISWDPVQGVRQIAGPGLANARMVKACIQQALDMVEEQIRLEKLVAVQQAAAEQKRLAQILGRPNGIPRN